METILQKKNDKAMYEAYHKHLLIPQKLYEAQCIDIKKMYT